MSSRRPLKGEALSEAMTEFANEINKGLKRELAAAVEDLAHIAAWYRDRCHQIDVKVLLDLRRKIDTIESLWRAIPEQQS